MRFEIELKPDSMGDMVRALLLEASAGAPVRATFSLEADGGRVVVSDLEILGGFPADGEG